MQRIQSGKPSGICGQSVKNLGAEVNQTLLHNPGRLDGLVNFWPVLMRGGHGDINANVPAEDVALEKAIEERGLGVGEARVCRAESNSGESVSRNNLVRCAANGASGNDVQLGSIGKILLNQSDRLVGAGEFCDIE